MATRWCTDYTSNATKRVQLQHYCRSNSKSRLQRRRPWVYIRHTIWISLIVVLSRVLTKRILLEFGCWFCFAVRHDCLSSRLTVVLSPAVSSDDIYLRVVSLLFAVNFDENILKNAGRVDICLQDVGHETRCPRLGAHLSGHTSQQNINQKAWILTTNYASRAAQKELHSFGSLLLN